MEELDKIVQRMIDAGESEENIKIVIENYKPEETVETGAAKTEAVATETAPVTAENPAADMDSTSVDGSLEQLKNNTIPEVNSADWNKVFAKNVTSSNFSDLTSEQVTSLNDKAISNLIKQSSDKEFSFDDTEIRLEASRIFRNNILPEAKTEELTTIEEKLGVNAVTDFISDLYRGAKSGWAAADAVDPTFELLKNGGDVSDDDISNFIKANKSVADSNVESDEMRDFNRVYESSGGGVLGFLKGIAESPSVMPTLLVTSLATQAGAIWKSEEVAASAALTAGAGAVAGSVVPGIGTASGAIGGFLGGGAAAMESALTFSELLQEEVGDGMDVIKIREILEDPDKLADLRNKSIGRGITIGVFEGLTGGVAKGVGSKLAKIGVNKYLRSGAAGVLEMAGGGGGEVAGRLVAGQEMDVKEIGFETVTGTATAPISVGAQLLNLDNTVNNFKLKKELKGSSFTSFEEAFSPSEKMSNTHISLAKMKGGEKILNSKIEESLKKGDISKAQGEDIKLNYRETQSAVNTIDKSSIRGVDVVEAVELLKEKKKRAQNIKNIDDSALTKTESDRVAVIDSKLSELATKGSLEKTTKELDAQIKSIEKIASKIDGVNVKSLDNAEAIDTFIVENKLDIDKKASGNQGFIYQNPDTGEQTIIINKEVAKKEQAVNVAGHEFLHGLLFQTVKNSPETQISLGKSLNEYINKIDTKQVKDSDFVKRLENYKDMDEATQSEEVLTLFSDAIVTGDIQFNEGVFTKIGDVIRRTLQNLGVNIKFNNGKDVYNFVKDYNKSIEKGSLTKAQKTVAAKGAKGTLVSEKVEASEAGIKESRQLTSDQDKLVASEVIDLQVIKKENKELAAKYNKEPIKGAKEVRLENKVLETLDPIIGRVVTDRTKALYDPIVDDAKKTVSRKDFQESMRSDIQAMIFEEFNGKQDIEKFIVNRAFLRANNLAKRLGIQSVEEGITKGLEAAEKIAIDETVATVDKDVKLTKATKILSSDQLNRAKESIAKMDIDPSQISYKKLGNVTADITAELVGVPAEKIISKTKNLSKSETTTAAMFIEKNVDYIRRTLPEGAVLEAATEKLIGTSTGVPKAMLNAFYAKGKRLSKGAGLIPWNKNKGITNNDILEAIGRPKGEKPSPIDPRSPKGQMIKGIISIVDKNITNELVRTEKDLTIEQEVDAGAGRSALMFSKSLGVNEKFKLIEVASAKNINEAGKLSGIEGKITINNDNRVARQNAILKAIIDGNIPSSIFELAKFGNFGRWNRRGSIVGGKFKPNPLKSKYYRLKNGTYIKDKSSEFKKAEENGDFLPGRGGLYHGIKDPAYLQALNAAKVNDKNYPKYIKPKRVSNNYFSKESAEQSKTNMDSLELMATVLQNAVHKHGMTKEDAALFIASSYQATTGIIKIAARFKYASKVMEYGNSPKQNKGAKYREEHNPPASVIGANLIWAISNNKVSEIMPFIKENYHQTQLSKLDDEKIDHAKLDATLPAGFSIMDNPIVRLAASGIDLNTIINQETGKTVAEEIQAGIDSVVYNKMNDSEKNIAINYQNDQIIDQVRNKTDKAGVNINNFIKLVPSKAKASISNNNALPSSIKYSKDITIQEGIDALAKTDKALDNARKLDAPVKKIRVFDFDDTLAQTKSNVLYTMPDGTEGKIDAATFAKEAGNMEAEGAVWDFSEFSKVVDGKKGPLFGVAKIIADKRGTDDVFVLTARPANAAGPIKEFLASMGLDIPVGNITGLGDGAPQAKAGWIMGKAAEGYNDFYFADDHTGNVKAVKDVLSQIDVKSKVQLAKVKFSKTLDLDFNKIIENKTGIASEKIYARVKAEVVGASKGKFDFFIPPSAEDFVGLLYKTLGKGKIGDAQMAWYKKHLLDPYARAMESVTRDKNTLGANFKSLKKELGIIPRNLKKKITGEAFTKEQAVRVYIWNQTGQDVPGLSKSDNKDLVDYIKSNPELELFAQEIMKLSKGSGYIKASDSWVTGTITTDLMEALNTTRRKQYLEQWQQNIDVIFSKENMNKLEAAYGKSYRESLEGMLKRMKIGRNRTQGMDGLTGRFVDWTTSATGAIMFFNTRSAVLQTLSAVNFINFGDNNIIAAGKAFANQPQYWSDFKMLFNSDFLVERRNGLKMNVNEADIADIAKERGVRGVVNKLLKLGFTPTQIADSFAIAAGGSTFYRNRVKSLVKNGMDTVAAEKQAMRDFRETAEESQQSSRPDKISQQQAGPLGRVILAFANTPAQYARIIKKAASDIKNGRGDLKTNVSKIIYYSIAQNLLFNALQSAILATMFGEDEEEDPKTVRIANGMLDSILRGIGVGGAIVSVIKNAGIKWVKESDKKRADYTKVVDELLKISPPISSKIGKLKNATRSYSWDKKEMMEGGFGLDNPAYLAIGNVVSATTNIPMDRVVKKINNLKAASDSELEAIMRIHLLAGWSEWELGVDSKKKPKKKPKNKRYNYIKSKITYK